MQYIWGKKQFTGQIIAKVYRKMILSLLQKDHDSISYLFLIELVTSVDDLRPMSIKANRSDRQK